MHRQPGIFQRSAFLCEMLAVLCLALAIHAATPSLPDARALLLAGKYEECLRACEKGDTDDYRAEGWQLIRAEALLAQGLYPEAEAAISQGITRAPNSIRLRVRGYDTANAAGNLGRARLRLREINDLVVARPWAYRDAPDLVAVGRAALLMGADPKTVLERFFGAAQKADPTLRDIPLATGQLALDKNDYALAAKTFTEALRKFPNDPELLHGLARAYEPSARARMLELSETALKHNENHVPSMLLLADHLVAAEAYAEADKMLNRALRVNPWHPEGWAYRAVLAHLRNDAAGEQEARRKALRYWPTNPRVDHLIGLKLSQKYRFAEGSAFQRQALAFDPDFLPAQRQLAEDLLRLGDAVEGWKLVDTVHRQDAYDVTAYNLVTLQGTMRKFATLTNEHFILRMSAQEAALYGDRALALLQRARAQLTEKYGVQLERPTTVEIFPEQKDFAVRTFGMPHNPGFLGVCFGHVVTANSPASQGGNPSNWEAVLWHESCHVITLQMTKNKMPRWLSEGISVYEELQANPAWGQRMNPRYREMVLGGDLTPVSELSSVFMTAQSDLHVQFAYYQSALVVEYLVGQFGFEQLKAILRDLGEGADINDAIQKHTAPMKQIEKGFAAFAKAKAEALGPGLDWEKPNSERGLLSRLGLRRATPSISDTERERTPQPSLLVAEAPTNNLHEASPPSPQPPVASAAPAPSERSVSKPNYWTLLEQAAQAVSEQNWPAAKVPLQTLVAHYPEQSGPNNAYALLANVHRGLKETAEERAALEQWAAREADALAAYLRLMELAEAARDWPVVSRNAERFLAVNPLLPQPYRFLSRASEELGETQPAIGAYQKLLLLDPADPAEVHYRLARLLHATDAPAARRQVLQALEEAPRFREAHRLLLELAQTDSSSSNAPANP
ncbi:MAG: hypothetical protein KIS67_17295 [Verrucomicrobiae bacterium]|nr:hypothetical protein [Verrucomicrobiae bacterium]